MCCNHLSLVPFLSSWEVQKRFPVGFFLVRGHFVQAVTNYRYWTVLKV